MSEITDEEFQALGKAKIAEGVATALDAFDALEKASTAVFAAMNNPNFLGGVPAELNQIAPVVNQVESSLSVARNQREMQPRLNAQINGTVNIGV